MEVKIGVQNVARELVLESDQTPDQVVSLVEEALADRGTLRLEDEKGRILLVPVASLGYVDVAPTRRGGVGFGNI